jgi:hypothetical protein
MPCHLRYQPGRSISLQETPPGDTVATCNAGFSRTSPDAARPVFANHLQPPASPVCVRARHRSVVGCLARAGPAVALAAVVAISGRCASCRIDARLDREMQGIDLDDVAGARMTARWMTFSSSRTLPGQACDCKAASAARQAQARTTGAPPCAARKWRASGTISSTALPQRRDQQGKDVEPIEQVLAKMALATASAMSRLEVATTRISRTTGFLPPTRSTSRS